LACRSFTHQAGETGRKRGEAFLCGRGLDGGYLAEFEDRDEYLGFTDVTDSLF
jgi:hypothetical protein